MALDIRNFRDFLLLYNQISETCFVKCTDNFNSRQLSADEGSCVNSCTQKYINMNHKLMSVYVEVQGQIVQKRIDEMNSAQAAADAKAATDAKAAADATALAEATATFNDNVAEDVHTTVDIKV